MHLTLIRDSGATTNGRFRAHPGPSRSHRAFTLVELLVVIGIIALLISILLPSLNAARRQARSVKCLSNIRQIGHGFFMYAQQFKGAFPVAVHESGSWMPLPQERRWYDLIAEYVTAEKMTSIDDLERVRENSTLWGCPEWTRIEQYESPLDKYRPGYGMNYYPTYFEDFDVTKLAYITGNAANKRGMYVKQTNWTKASQRALVADSVTHVLSTPLAFNSGGKWFPYDPIVFGAFYVDARRHGRYAMTKAESYNRPSVNVLFCDGHAETLSVRQTYNAVASPGMERAGP